MTLSVSLTEPEIRQAVSDYLRTRKYSCTPASIQFSVSEADRNSGYIITAHAACTPKIEGTDSK